MQPDDVVHTIAAEDQVSRRERARLEAKESAILRSLHQLHRLDCHNFGRESVSP